MHISCAPCHSNEFRAMHRQYSMCTVTLARCWLCVRLSSSYLLCLFSFYLSPAWSCTCFRSWACSIVLSSSIVYAPSRTHSLLPLLYLSPRNKPNKMIQKKIKSKKKKTQRKQILYKHIKNNTHNRYKYISELMASLTKSLAHAIKDIVSLLGFVCVCVRCSHISQKKDTPRWVCCFWSW